MATDILSKIWPEWTIDEKPLGRGSYGTVYKAVRRDHNVESYAAIKVISIPSDQSEVDSLRSEGLDLNATRTYLQSVVNDFISEIQLMESFKGVQNIVSVEDYKVVEKQDELGWDIYIRMELLTPLNSYICDKTLTEAEVVKLGVDICSALELCAKRNVIHRDIKPENIFINQFGDFKLGDFGIARKLENVTGGLSQKGTYNYMAPEVEKGAQYDATVDLYSLGLVLYRFTNKNRLPFLDTERQLLNPNERMAAIRRRMDGEPLPPPCEASPALAQVILYACAHDPKHRFTSATAMKNALKHAVSGANAAGGPSKPASVRPAPPVQDPNRTASVRKAPQAQTPAQAPVQKPAQAPVQKPTQTPPQKPIDTFGKKKRSKAPVVIAALLIVALLAGAGIFLLPKLTGKDNGPGGTAPENTARLATKENDPAGTGTAAHTTAPTEKPDAEQIAAAIQEADALAAGADYEGALARLKTELASHPDDASLLAKQAEYTDALAAQKKEKALAEAEALANSKDYSGAMAVIERTDINYADDPDYKAAYDRYQQSYIAAVKAEAIAEADSMAAEGNYIDASVRISQAIVLTGADAELEAKKTGYETSYATEISAQIDTCLAEYDVASAKELLSAALANLPNNEILTAINNKIKDMAPPVRITDLSSISAVPRETNRLTDNYGNQYNYAIVNNHGYSGSAGPIRYEYITDSKYAKLVGTIFIPAGESSSGTSTLTVKGDSFTLYSSPAMNKISNPINLDVDIAGFNVIVIEWSNNSGYGNISDLNCCLGDAFFIVNNEDTVNVNHSGLPIALTDLQSIYSDVSTTTRLTDNTGNTYSTAIYNRVDNYRGNRIPVFEYLLDSKYSKFECTLYVPAGSTSQSSVVMIITADGEKLYTSPEMTSASVPVQVSIDITGCNDFQITFSERSWYNSNSDATVCLADPFLYLSE